MNNSSPDLKTICPTHQVGSYRAWNIEPHIALPFDMLWVSRAPDEDPVAHHFLPFVEPSIVVRRINIGGTAGDYGPEILVSSAYPDSGWYRPDPGEELIGLRLRPETSAAQLGISPRDYCSFEPVQAPARLKDALSPIRSVADRGTVADVARCLWERLPHLAGPICNTPATKTAHIIRSHKGRISCGRLAALLEISERHLRRVFVDEFGISPKAYAQRIRLTAAIVRAESTTDGWADIALAAGYSDQSHLIRDCRMLMGKSPNALVEERRAVSGFSNNVAA